MNKLERGKSIVSAAKALKRYRASEPHIAGYLHAAFAAGRAGLLASALRSHKLNYTQVSVMAAEEGFSPIDLKTLVVPWLESAGLCMIERQNGEIHAIRSIVLAYDNILAAVTDLYDSVEPSEHDRACLTLMQIASEMPISETEALNALAQEFGEEVAKLSITLAKSFRLVDYREGRGLREPILFTSRLWASCMERASSALSSLSSTDRAVMLELVKRVRVYQGMPRSHLSAFATENNAQHLLRLAINIRLIHETRIEMASGGARAFLTTPHFYEDIASEHGEDVCDRVKIFLDSIRNGQHFGDASTGRIFDPERLLAGLLNRRRIGPCTAIGTDYVTSEKAGIVTVSRAAAGSSRCFLELVQRDTVQKVYDVITTGTVETRPEMLPSHVQEGRKFRSIEECATTGEVPENMAEAERAIILQLREGG